MVVQKGISHNYLTLESFYVNKVTLDVNLGAFAFASAEAPQRGGIIGFDSDTAALCGILEQLTLFKHNSSETRLFLCQVSEFFQMNSSLSDALPAAISFMREHLRQNLN